MILFRFQNITASCERSLSFDKKSNVFCYGSYLNSVRISLGVWKTSRCEIFSSNVPQTIVRFL